MSKKCVTFVFASPKCSILPGNAETGLSVKMSNVLRCEENELPHLLIKGNLQEQKAQIRFSRLVPTDTCTFATYLVKLGTLIVYFY